jgi:hypothetical protein
MSADVWCLLTSTNPCITRAAGTQRVNFVNVTNVCQCYICMYLCQYYITFLSMLHVYHRQYHKTHYWILVLSMLHVCHWWLSMLHCLLLTSVGYINYNHCQHFWWWSKLLVSVNVTDRGQNYWSWPLSMLHFVSVNIVSLINYDHCQYYWIIVQVTCHCHCYGSSLSKLRIRINVTYHGQCYPWSHICCSCGLLGTLFEHLLFLWFAGYLVRTRVPYLVIFSEDIPRGI